MKPGPYVQLFQCSQTLIEAVAKMLDAHNLTIDIPIFCPYCSVQHVDRPDPESFCKCAHAHNRFPTGIDPSCPHCFCEHFRHWNNPPHSTHLCKVEDGGCGKTFKPFPFNTNGVRMDT